jgi:hypothetical protein
MNRAPGHQPPDGTTTLIGRRSSSLARRIAPISTSLGLLALGLALGLGLRTPPANAQNTGTESPSTRSTGASSPGTRAIHANTNAGTPPANETPENLSQSIQRRKDFPFPASCDGNTQKCWPACGNGGTAATSACANCSATNRCWSIGTPASWHSAAAQASGVAGGSIQPLLWLGCENALNATMIEKITSPLGR